MEKKRWNVNPILLFECMDGLMKSNWRNIIEWCPLIFFHVFLLKHLRFLSYLQIQLKIKLTHQSMELQPAVFEQSQFGVHHLVADSAFLKRWGLQWRDTGLSPPSKSHCKRTNIKEKFVQFQGEKVVWVEKVVMKVCS
jgi:hypothetical protein